MQSKCVAITLLLSNSLPTTSFLARSLTALRASPTMSQDEAGSEKTNKTSVEEQTKGFEDQAGSDQNKELGPLAANVIPHILNLYGLEATPADFEMYSPKATFEDPLMKAKGVKQIKSAFYSMPKIFSEGKIVEYYVHESETTSGSGEIRIDNVQHYKVCGKSFDMRSLIKLQVEDGKVTRHEDLWDKHPLWTRETVRVPLVGRAVEGWRRFNLLTTHVLMGFGKDPRPKE